MAGQVITTSLSNVKHLKADEYWLITRAGKDIAGLERHLGLAPSPELFNRYWNHWRGTDPATWWPTYTQLFNAELRTEEKLAELRTLYRLVQAGKTVALVCYCGSPDHCHRRLVGEFLSRYGVEVNEAQSPPREIQLGFDLSDVGK